MILPPHEALPAERPGSPAGPGLLERRRLFAATEADPALDVRVEDEEVDGIPCRSVTAGGEATVIHLHGGGFRMGSPEAYTAYAAKLAAGAEARVILPRYRLAPEYPYPAGLRDAVAVYTAVAARSSGPVIVAGDSAGAALAAGVVAVSRAGGIDPPSGIMLLSPWLDLRCTSSFYERSVDPLFTLDTARSAREDYLQGRAADDPSVSPLLADHTGHPPTLIQVGAEEALVGDALEFAGSLARAKVTCTLEILAGQGHTWPLVAPGSRASATAVESSVRFIRRTGAGASGLS